MVHIRTTIRNRVIEALRGATAAGNSVFGPTARTFNAAQLPVIEVSIESENVERFVADGDWRREMELSLEIMASSTSAINTADILDSLAAEVEVTMDNGIEGVFDQFYTGMQFEAAREGAQEVSFMTLSYQLAVITESGNPHQSSS